MLNDLHLHLGSRRPEWEGALVMHLIVIYSEFVCRQDFKGPSVYIQQLVWEYFTLINKLFLRSLARLAQGEAFGQLFPPQHEREFVSS